MLRKRLVSTARSLLERFDKRPRPEPEAPPPPPPEPPRVPKPVNWELRSQHDLVDHIIEHYHGGLRRDLPLLVELARSTGPAELADLVESLANELEGHMLKEERVLFPQLRTGQRGGSIDMPIRMMEREHEGHEDVLSQIRAVTDDLAAPDDASPAVRKLYADIRALEVALREHVYLENNVLFARAMGGEY